MREGRRFSVGFLFLLTLALLCISNIPLVYADADAVAESNEGGAEAVVDATGDVQVEDSESTKEVEDAGAAAEAAGFAAGQAAAAETETAAARAAEAEAAAAKAAAEASAIVDEAEKAKSTAFVGDVAESAKSKAMSFVGKAKEVTPEQMKKVAAGALGVWGVAAGAGWVMNNLGGVEE
mmetsp:Transcript_8598/g.19324  ORF Transcript_8598/g.19324 Transcript_8598/m.19324 type:complete len:179 (-) Transcript_8598:330-866(-)|eukprot:CAMPEP_0172297726 /NCGR_PEP_ID=MMETSP1058-20130122/641_1 /TAXON_ID=83371 /ORGANISM="Detonula confervacea, Strain CCMP 353" /LENGTH=178 /DNA_ID=CAMNT_0013006909 /DNA_START=87 /DNA_END=623 /DNA_ORIENTATION=-